MEASLVRRVDLTASPIQRCLFDLEGGDHESEYAIHCTPTRVPPRIFYRLAGPEQQKRYREALQDLGIRLDTTAASLGILPSLFLVRPLCMEEVQDSDWVTSFGRLRPKTRGNTPDLTEALDQLYAVQEKATRLHSRGLSPEQVISYLLHPYYDVIGPGMGTFSIAFIHYLVERYHLPLDMPVMDETLGSFLSQTKEQAQKAGEAFDYNALCASLPAPEER